MGFIGALSGIRKILGKLTDILLKGRQAGLWQEKPSLGKLKKGK